MSQAVAADDRTPDLQPETDDEAAVSILTNGDPIRSWAQLLAPIGDEFRVEFDQDGIHLRQEDAAKVAMVDLTAHAEGFPKFEIDDGFTFGLNLERFQNAVKWARKRGGDGDPVAIDVYEDPARMQVRITRPDQQMKRFTEWFAIAPESIRGESDIPDLDLPNRATPGVTPLREGIKALSSHDHAHVTRDGGTFILGSQEGGETMPADVDDDPQDAIKFPNCAWDDRDDESVEAFSSLFSLDYLEDMATALHKAKADRLTIEWGEQFPTKIHFEHEEWGFEGQYLLAPRITED